MTQPGQTRRGHPYFMYDAIMGQPQAIQQMLHKHVDTAREVAAIIAKKRRLHLVGIGTSWHAALIAQYWFRRFAGTALEVQAWHSFEFCSYPPPLNEDDVVIVVSHRGTKTYSFLALQIAKRCGPYTVAITATDPGLQIQVADAVLHTIAQEKSAAFTVSYTTALTVLAMLGIAVGSRLASSNEVSRLGEQLEEVPGAVSQVLAKSEAVQQAARRFADRQRFICIAWGPNTANAYEVALKMKETSATDTEGLQVEQLLHGPFCSVDHQCLLTLVAPLGPGYQRALSIASAAAAVEAPVWALVQEGDSSLSTIATAAFTVPAIPEVWSPLVYVVPLQLFTYYLALAKGTHPDLFQQDNPKQAAARRYYNL